MKVTFFGEKVFADVIKLRIRTCGLSWWASNAMKIVLIREHRRKNVQVKTTGVTKLQAKELLVPPESRRFKRRFSPESLV